MAFNSNKNYKFYKDFDGEDGWKYRLWFIPGHNADLSAPAEMELPGGVLVNRPKATSEYEDSYPYGFPLADEIELELELEAFVTEGTNDWGTVRGWIVDGNSGTDTRNVGILLSDMVIPNNWYLMSNDGDGTTTYATMEWDCVQEKKPEKNFKISSVSNKMKIKLLDTERIILEKITFEIYWRNTTAVTDYVDEYAFIYYFANTFYQTDIFATAYRVGDGKIYYENLSNFFSELSTLWSTIKSAYKRVTHSVTFYRTPFYYWTLYKQDDTYNNAKGAEITNDADIQFIYRVKNANDDTVGGLMSGKNLFSVGNSQNTLDNHYNNFHDFLKYQVDALLCKAYIRRVDATTTQIQFKAILNTTANKSHSLTLSDFFGNEIEIEEGVGYVAQGIAHVKGVSNDDLDEITVRNEGILNESAWEGDHILHNQPRGTEEDNNRHDTITDGTTKKMFIKCFEDEPPAFSLFYLDTGKTPNILRKVHDGCDFDWGGTSEISNETLSGSLPTTYGSGYSRGNFYDVLKAFNDTRAELSGMAYVSAKAGAYLFGSEKQTLIKGKVKMDKAQPRYIGDIYTINVNNLIPSGNYMNTLTTAILVKCVADYDTHFAECEFFVLGVT